MWRNNEYKMSFHENSIHEYEKIILTSGDCGYLLPMVFIGVKEKEIAYYKCDGFSPLSEFKLEKTEDVIFILEKVLLIIRHLSDYLITPSRLTITEDTVFYNEQTGELKIAYVPSGESDSNIRKALLNFLIQLKSDVADGLEGYLEESASMITNPAFEIRDMVNHLGLLRRKLYSQTSGLS